ncbi:MAG: ESX secretion-associated protein EspG [Nocardioides sp.]
MATIDVTPPTPAPAVGAGILDALPRRVALTLPELQLAGRAAGDAPLPFDLTSAAGADPLEGRLGVSRGSNADSAYAAALVGLHDPADTLQRRGLLDGGDLDPGLAGALGLLATPRVAIDLDVSVQGLRAHAWHREADGAVATLSTVDGVVFELTWFPSAAWAAELGRVAVLPDTVRLRGTVLPDLVDLPFEVLDTAGEAVRSGRSDLIPVLAAQHSGAVFADDGTPVRDVELAAMLSAVVLDSRGRLRALGADVSGEHTSVVGVVAWTLLADGWRSLRPHRDGDRHRVEVRRVEPGDLPGDLAFVLAEVTR